jgi:hypothetical protein
LIRAEHFFWIVGDAAQKSREGLLRHLLLSALLSLPADNLDLAKHVCGLRRLSTHSQPSWSYEELYDMLVRLVSYSEAKFFFLVDALDECDPQDFHAELASEIIKISCLPNVKLCVSCRPWKPFMSRFREDQTLCLDEMTYRDMKCYIHNRLANADGENELCSEFTSTGRTERAAKFVAGVADAAEGVFLWTELIVKALGSELRKGCGFQQLQEVQKGFPIGLDEYFQKFVFDRITRTRQNISDTAAALMLALKIAGRGAPRRYSFFNFWLLATGKLTAGFSWTNHDGSHYSCEDIERMVRLTTGFVQETCKDLLVVTNKTPGRSWDVEFLHRTVSDFLYDDHIRLTIEQQSPDHFQDADFLDELGKLRLVCLLSQAENKCQDAEDIFAQSIRSRWPQLLSQRDRAWLAKCEALTLHVHQRMQKAGICRINHHSTTWVHRYINAGLSEYLLALMVLWPCHAVRASGVTGSPEDNVLERFLLGWLTSTFAEPQIRMLDRAAMGGLQSMASSRGCVPSLPDDFTCSTVRFTTYLQNSLAATGDGRIKLFQKLLSCGIDPNYETFGQPRWRAPDRSCRRSVWQNWLRVVYLELCKKEASELKHPAKIGNFSNHVKNTISDFVTVFMQYGADPTCSICISSHLDVEDCKLESLESVLPIITLHDRLSQVQTLRIMYSMRFNRRVARHDHMRRAMRSWTASKRTLYSMNDYYSQLDLCAFLSGFVQNIGGFWCDCSSCCNTIQIFAAAICLECTGGYYMCTNSAKKHYPSIPTQNDVSRHLMHECLASRDLHEYIWFGQGDGYIFYGVESSMSILEAWYARNTNGEDTTLD